MARMLSAQRITEVINCGSWQAVRIAMKGTSTQFKVDLLKEYLEADGSCQYNPGDIVDQRLGRYISSEDDWLSKKGLTSLEHYRHGTKAPCGYRERRDQILNYLNALARAGLIAPLSTYVYSGAANNQQGTIEFDHVVIRRG